MVCLLGHLTTPSASTNIVEVEAIYLDKRLFERIYLLFAAGRVCGIILILMEKGSLFIRKTWYVSF